MPDTKVAVDDLDRRELDKAIAREVMGLEEGPNGCWRPAGEEDSDLTYPMCPEYSTYIPSAWRLAKEVNALHQMRVDIAFRTEVFDTVTVSGEGVEVTEEGGLAPTEVLLCRAILKAVRRKGEA